ncbi:interleukin-11 receptor subunit alpha isoform X1 [Oncorhynchus mykiss]|uniref:interleukin-11 receptor subunit alpha isoform X1 n=1 Tax=Oncorhynchus mykiss TaxID=8022 RepID=UPI0018775641|nr:interleukin-11 receptor subunit alpha isoform X1 [Oncorhynchus mykiss]XP_036832503.1 interleukin-11 receptor subunit alpha isoform X1 [Oncorhynchus mykiss]XP_036832504.1 interleukin-11 receptor subunit alpha isoform X1 [Oncorhynchus mykiss]
MPGLVSCPGGLIVIGLLLLHSSSVNTLSEIWTNEDVQYGRIGSNVTLLCRDALDRTSVEWRLNRRSVLPWQHRVTSGGHLVLVHAEHAAEGNYSCHDEQGLLIQTTRLRLGYPPSLLSISCLVPNHSLVLCSWVESVKTHLPALYHTSYRGNKSQVRMCVVSSPPQKQCIITDPAMWQLYHYINITETNPLGSQTTIIQVKFHKLLQPDPPEAVTAVGMVGYPMRLQVSWTNPASWLHDAVPFPLHFQLRYRPVGSSIWSTVSSSSHHLSPPYRPVGSSIWSTVSSSSHHLSPPYRPVGSSIWSTVESKASALLITDALAGHAHQLQVRAQDEINPDSQWSDWSPLLQAWPWSGCTADPTEQIVPVDYNDKDAEPSTANTKSENSEDDGGNLGVVIFLSLFAVIIIFLLSSLFVLMWVRQWRRDNVTRQELTSMLKMKSCISEPRLAPPLHQAIPLPAVCSVHNTLPTTYQETHHATHNLPGDSPRYPQPTRRLTTLPTTYQETHHAANNPSGVSAWPGRCLPIDRHDGPTD